ncbi:hypothetical protein BH11MYX1_BH11MYX1_54940 [soil metagenome]
MQSIVVVALLALTAAADPLVDPIRDAAKAYRTWSRVDEEPNIAPELCRQPLPADYGHPAEVRQTKATGGPHKDKLYYLWASDKDGYLGLGKQGQPALPIGFAVVKESFSSKKLDPHAKVALEISGLPAVGMLPAIKTLKIQAGDTLEIDQPKGLFVMVKVGERPGADHGWIYGTVAPDGKVTSAGKLATCMGCHVAGTHDDRLFGLAAK